MKIRLPAVCAALVFGLSSLGWNATAVAETSTSYQIMVETRVDGAAPTEVYIASFASLADVFSATVGAPTGFSEIEITPNYKITGLTWDGSAYRVLVETRLDGAAPTEVYLASFATLDDLFTSTVGPETGFTEIEITPDYQIAGLTWDGAAYRVLVETRLDGAAPTEVYLASFATLDDLFTSTIGAETGFTEIEITPNYQIVGFSSVTTFTPPPPAVPEPATWGLMIVGFGGIGMAMRRRQGPRLA